MLIVSPVFWPEAFRVNDFATRLADLGHQVEVLAGHPHYPEGKYYPGYGWAGPWRENWGGIHVLRFPQTPRGKGQAWRLALQYLTYLLLGSLRLLVKWRWDWDVIFVFQTTPVTAALPGLLAGRLSGARTVIWIQDLWPGTLGAVGMELPKVLDVQVLRLSAGIYQAFDLVLAQNEAFLPKLVEMGVERAQLGCVPQWADEGDGLEPSMVPMGWPEGFTILFAGNLGRAQGLGSVLKAAELTRKVPNLQWVLMGDGSMRETLEAEVRRLGLEAKVHFLGRRPAGEMPVHYARAQILLISLGAGQALAATLPGKVQACLAAGRPILAAAEGATARVVMEAGAGEVVSPESPEAIAAAVLRLMTMPEGSLDEFGRRGKAYYQKKFSRMSCLKALAHTLERPRNCTRWPDSPDIGGEG